MDDAKKIDVSFRMLSESDKDASCDHLDRSSLYPVELKTLDAYVGNGIWKDRRNDKCAL